MKIKLLLIGKTDEEYLRQGIDKYINRLINYLKFEFIVIHDLKNTKNLLVEKQKR